MKLIYIGDIVNTHGIKGEVRILSDFKYKDAVFKKGMKIYIGKLKDEEEINTYRVHKKYDMITLKGIDNINDVIKYKGLSVYVNRSDIKVDGYLDEEIIGLEVVSNDLSKGKVASILKTKAHDILLIKDNKKKYMVPYINEFVSKIDLNNSKIYINEIKGLFDEN